MQQKSLAYLRDKHLNLSLLLDDFIKLCLAAIAWFPCIIRWDVALIRFWLCPVAHIAWVMLYGLCHCKMFYIRYHLSCTWQILT